MILYQLCYFIRNKENFVREIAFSIINETSLGRRDIILKEHQQVIRLKCIHITNFGYLLRFFLLVTTQKPY